MLKSVVTRLDIGAGLLIGWKTGPRLIEFFAWEAKTGERLLAAAVTERRRAKLEAAFRALACELSRGQTRP